jgi:AcrR family transcriptional regulator
MRVDARRNRARVLEAAEEVLARDGLAASMRAIADLAQVGVGTIYRQFPTKEALYQAIVVDRAQRLADRATELAQAGDAGEAFFAFFAMIVDHATTQYVLVDAVQAAGLDPKAGAPDLRGPIETLLVQAQRAGAVRPDLAMPELLALLSATCQGARQGSWSPALRDKTLGIIFDGLRPRP